MRRLPAVGLAKAGFDRGTGFDRKSDCSLRLSPSADALRQAYGWQARLSS